VPGIFEALGDQIRPDVERHRDQADDVGSLATSSTLNPGTVIASTASWGE
jgi:hypothetical protein